MKKHLIAIGTVVLLLAVGLSGCLDLMPDIGGISDGYDEDFEWAESDFVGTWKLTWEGNDIIEFELILTNDGHFTKKCIHKETKSDIVGKWFLRDASRDYDHETETFTFFCLQTGGYGIDEMEDFRFEWINKDKVILDYDEWNTIESTRPNWILERV